MCGIVGYIGKRDSQDILLKGLKKLEYRGYDSAGIAVFTKNGLEIKKVQRPFGEPRRLAARRAARRFCRNRSYTLGNTW